MISKLLHSCLIVKHILYINTYSYTLHHHHHPPLDLCTLRVINLCATFFLHTHAYMNTFSIFFVGANFLPSLLSVITSPLN